MAARTKGKLVRLTPDEFAEIERRARRAGFLPARYLRHAALSGAPARPTAGEIVHALGRVGVDLKALASGTSDAAIRDQADHALRELLAVLRDLRQERHS
jgi:mobilization protein NikA